MKLTVDDKVTSFLTRMIFRIAFDLAILKISIFLFILMDFSQIDSTA